MTSSNSYPIVATLFCCAFSHWRGLTCVNTTSWKGPQSELPNKPLWNFWPTKNCEKNPFFLYLRQWLWGWFFTCQSITDDFLLGQEELGGWEEDSRSFMAVVLTSLTFRAILPKLCPQPGFWWGGGWCSLVSPLSTGRCLQKEILPLGQGMLWMIHNTLKASTSGNRPIAFSSLGLFFFFSGKQLSWASRHQDDSSWLPSELATRPKGKSLKVQFA